MVQQMLVSFDQMDVCKEVLFWLSVDLQQTFSISLSRQILKIIKIEINHSNVKFLIYIPSAPYNRKASFLPGIVILLPSWLNLIRGVPFTSTNLYTQPRAGCLWHVTRFKKWGALLFEML